jgi:hypothetical protein
VQGQIFENLLRQCLLAYEAKDIDTIAGMFSSDVTLRDWNLEVQGKPAAIQEFKKNFEQAKSLKIEIKRVFQSVVGAAAELEITVNGEEKLNVVDVMTFNDAGQITEIISYKGL